MLFPDYYQVFRQKPILKFLLALVLAWSVGARPDEATVGYLMKLRKETLLRLPFSVWSVCRSHRFVAL